MEVEARLGLQTTKPDEHWMVDEALVECVSREMKSNGELSWTHELWVMSHEINSNERWTNHEADGFS